MAADVQGIKLDLELEITDFKAKLTEVKRTINLTTDSVKTFKQALKSDPTNTKFLEAYNKSLDELEKNAKEARDGLQKLFDEGMANGMDVHDERFKALTRSLTQMDNVINNAIPKYREFADGIGEVSESAKDGSESLQATNVMLGNLWSDAIKFGLNSLKSAFDAILDVVKKVASGIAEVLKTGVSYNMSMERYATSIKAILDGDEESTNRLVKAMKQLGASSAFSVDALLEGAQQLVAADVAADDAAKSINDLAKALAYAGKGDDELKRMVQNLNQIKNAGKSTAMDLKQFAYAGVPIYKLLAEYSSEFQSIGKDTLVTYEDIVGALSKAAGEGGKFYQAIEVQGSTMFGQLEMMKSNALTLAGIVATDLTDALTSHYMPAVNNLIQAMVTGYDQSGLQGLIDAFQNGVGNLLDELGNEETVDKFFDNATLLLQGIADAFDPTTEKGQANREKLVHAAEMFGEKFGEFIAKNKEPFFNLGVTLGEAVVDGFMSAVAEINADIDRNDPNRRRPNNMGGRSGGFGTSSGGYGELASRFNSGGYSGGVMLTANFTVNNANNITNSTMRMWASTMADMINDELGGRI